MLNGSLSQYTATLLHNLGERGQLMQRKGGKEKTSSCREHMLVKYFSGENFKNKDES